MNISSNNFDENYSSNVADTLIIHKINIQTVLKTWMSELLKV